MTIIDKSELTFIIPVKRYSERVPDKNTREFYQGKTLLDIKIQQLLNHIPAKNIIIVTCDKWSSDLQKHYSIQQIQEPVMAPTFYEHLVRCAQLVTTPYFCRCTVTMPFYNGEMLMKSLEKFRNNPGNLLAQVSEIRGHVTDQNFTPINYGKSGQHEASQNVAPLYSLKPAALIIESARALELAAGPQAAGLVPIIDKIEEPYSLDINYLDEWKHAKLLLENKKLVSHIGK